MNHEESLTVTQMIFTTWPTTRVWTTEEIAAYAAGLQRYDAETCVRALASAQQKLMYRPSVAELREFYDLERAKTRAREDTVTPPPVRKEKVPLWVRRWVAARYLHSRFGKDQDMRAFPEQRDFANPYVDMMPADAWLDEAQHVTDKQVWNILTR